MNPSAPNVMRIAAGILLTSVASLFAQTTATTDPVGFITLNVAGTGGAAAPALSFKGLGLTRAIEYQGSAETVGANTIVDNDATWTDNQFNGANGAYYLEISTGSGAGTTYDIQSTAAGTKTITLAQNLANGVAAPVTFKIRKHWTIASVFGPTNEAGLLPGDATTADQILIFNGTGYDIYYYQTGGFGTGWRSGNDAVNDAGPTKIYPDDGLIVKRKGSANVNVVLLGAVKTGQSSFPISVGTNVVGNVYAANMTLQSSGLYTGNTTTGLAGGDATSADQVLIWNGTGYDIYYYQTGGFGTGWRSGNDAVNDAGPTPIPVGSSIIVKRKAAPAFDWKAPQHPATL
ncbi:MAG TPA: TIGR02597 family protein [Chthoniobacteraceae bacterium]|nr:TIGR02597 family protein [Chthoniobacteraceae bacterium]